jgi:outer membrane protein TolC
MMRLIVIQLFVVIGTSVFAKDLQFEKIWEKINVNSKVLKASAEQVEATHLNMSRSEKHWLPTLYMTGQSYITNDSGANMFGLLSQRKIEQADFNPTILNDPEANHFTKGALGLNFSLYEGGMKEAMKKASSFQFESKKSENGKNKIEYYSEVSKNYFTLVSLNLQKNQLDKVGSTLKSIIGKYQIGNKGNMVGYSGLLGLKSLKNRLLAIKDENNAKMSAYSNALNELAESSDKITFSGNEDIQKLLNEYLNSNSGYAPSDKIKSLEYNAMATAEIIGAEKSRNLPRIGVFTEGNIFNGKRDTATGYAAGLYLNWNLFSGNDVGATEEAIHHSHAAKYYAEAMLQKEKIDFDAQNTMEETLVKTLVTLEESQKLLDEQMSVANNLFKNGMISALQLVEVLNRRVDLINSKTEVETKLIEAKAKKITLTNTQIDLAK